MIEKKPSLFIVGAPKCGTTSLHNYLEQHPNIYMSNPKEVNYFSNEELTNQNLYYQDFKITSESSYLSLFERASQKCTLLGEASVSYLFYPGIAQKIKKFNPNAKIVLLLRDPVRRAWSHYLMDKRMGLVRNDFQEIFYSNNSETSLNFQQLFLLGNYYTQVNRYFEAFGSNNVFVGFTDELESSPQLVMGALFKFLNIPNIKIDTSENFNSFKDTKSPLVRKLYGIHSIRKFSSQIIPISVKKQLQSILFNAKPPTLDKDFEQKLRLYYHDEIEKLENLLDKDLQEWKK